jgi:DNA-binding NarL/FixJ family response regulator
MDIQVLVVDDFPLVREGVVAALETDPAIHVVGQASSADEGVEMALELRPDVVVLDMRMPGAGGIVVLERLRETLPDTRVLVMTATEKAETLLEAVAAGASGYLTKRAARRELCDAVITVHGGGSVIPPHLASHLLSEYASVSRGEARSTSILTSRDARPREDRAR